MDCYDFCYGIIEFARCCWYTYGMNMIRPSANEIIPRDQALAVVADFLPVFNDCLDKAWQFVEKLFEEAPERRPAFSLTTRANMLYDRMTQLIRQELEGQPRTRMETRGRMLLLVIDSLLVVRFKKLDGTLRAKNVHTTSQRMDYHQLSLPGIENPGLTRLTFGYRLDETATEIVARYVTCSKNWQENHWSERLDETASDAMPIFSPPAESNINPNAGVTLIAKRKVLNKGSASA